MKWITAYTGMQNLESMKENGITDVMAAEKQLASRMPIRSSWEEIEEIKKTCDQLGLNLGLMLNRIYFDKDISLLKEALKRYKKMGIQRIEYTDPAVFIEAQKLGMENCLVYNPDTLMCNSPDVQFYLDLGISAVLLSKEITLDEMKEIIENTNGNTEVILFGRLNMSYSKRYLLSSYMKEIGKEEEVFDRKDLVLIETTREGKMPVVEDEHGTAVYTDYTLGGFNEMLPLMQSGVSAFRFDNSFMSNEVFVECLKGFNEVLQGKDGKAVFETLKSNYPELALDTGYMYLKTNLVK